MFTRTRLRSLVPLLLGFLAVYAVLSIAYHVGVASAGAEPLVVDTGPSVEGGPYLEIYVDAGIDAATTPSPATSSSVDVEDPGSLLSEAYRGITSGDWFIVAGSALCLVSLAVMWLLRRKWPEAMERDRWAILVVAVIAGATAIGHAWLAPGVDVDARTWLGAIKVWAAAAWQYVTIKKLFQLGAK